MKNADSLNHFRSLNKEIVQTKANDILLKVKKPDDLFYESVIPLSCKRLLHPDVEEFIIEEAEKSPGSDFRITIQVAEEHSFNVNEIASLIHRHFKSKTETASHQARKTVRLGWKTLFIGFLFLIVMYLLTKIVTGILPENALMISLRELFIILAWVALWRPADLLLYEWRIYKRNTKLFDRITKCKVQMMS